jgi:hypothetical protein
MKIIKGDFLKKVNKKQKTEKNALKPLENKGAAYSAMLIDLITPSRPGF